MAALTKPSFLVAYALVDGPRGFYISQLINLFIFLRVKFDRRQKAAELS